MKAQRILTVLLVSLGLLLALGVCLEGTEQAAAQPAVVAMETGVPSVRTPCITCAQAIAPSVEGAAVADGVSRFRERPGLDAPGGREWTRASISRTLPFGSVTLSETIAARRAATGPEVGRRRGLLEAGDCFAQGARNDVRLGDFCERELRPAAWREMALPSVSVAATVTLLTEGFETSVPPPGWVEEDVVGTEGDWTRAGATVNPPGGGAHGGAYLALFNSGVISAGAETRLRTPDLDLSHAVGSYYVSFWMYHDKSGFNDLFDDRLQLEVDDGSGWNDYGEPLYTGQGGVGWLRHVADLSAFRGKVIRLGFRAISEHILDVAIDDVEVYYVPAAPLLVSKTADRLAVAPGAALTYTVAITRGGLTPGTNIALTDTLDIYQRPMAVASSQGACAVVNTGWGGGITCTVGGLAVGASALVTLTAQVSASLPITPLQQITNTVNATAADGATAAQAAVYIDTCRVRLVEGATVTLHPTVQSAIDAASTPTSEVQVAGACFGVETRSNVRQAAYVDKTLILRGGYKADFSEWNTGLYTTYLHAAGLGRVAFISGTVTPLIEGFYLTGGDASAMGSLADPLLGYGGGILSLNAAPTIRGNVIARNDTGALTADRLGGGILLAGATLPTPARIEDNTVRDNVSGPYYGGGGIAVYASLGPIIARNVISGNVNRLDDDQQVSYGGGLFLISSDGATIEDNVITGNTACYDWMADMSGASCAGGGLFALDSYHLAVRNNQVVDNSAAREGWFGEGGGMYFGSLVDLDLSQNTVQTNAASAAGGDSSGGGIFLTHAADVMLLDNNIIGNRAIKTGGAGEGGGIYAVLVYTLTIDGNTIRENVACPDGDGSGGGVVAEWVEDLTLSNNLVQDNVASQVGRGSGGGIAVFGDEDIALIGNTVQGNRAGETEGTGGGILAAGARVTMTDNVVQSNVATTHGQGHGGGVVIGGSAALGSNTIISNTAGSGQSLTGAGCGGGVYGAGNLILDGNVIRHNSVGENMYGGGACFEDSNTTLRNNVIADNRGVTGTLGAGVYLEHIEGTLQHNTIVNNTGGDGSAIYAAEIYTSGLASLVNNIIAGHAVGVYAGTASIVQVDGVLWYGNTANTGGPGAVNVGAATTGDPAFGADGYHITSASAAVDRGVDCAVTDDIDGDPRPGGFGFDLGADEIPGPGLRLVKRASAWSLSAGETVTYAITVTSVGVSTAAGVRLTDTLPVEQQTIAITTDRGTCAPVAGWGGGFTCALGDMPPAASGRLTLTAQMTTTIPAILPPFMRNVVTATATGAARMAYADTYFTTCRARVGGGEYSAVQDAVDAAAAGSSVQIAGLCQGVNNRGGLRQHVYVNKSLTLEGGWNNDFSVRDPELYPTTIDPQGNGRAIYIANATVVTLTGLSLAHGSAAALGGYKPGSTTYDAGGGLYALNTRLVVTGCVIADGSVYRANYYGGGVFVNNGDGSVLLDNVIRDNRNAYNTYENRGGGLYAVNSDNLALRGNQFTGNQAAWGGGLALVDGATFTVEDNLVQGNLAVPSTENRGCGLYAFHGSSGVLADNRFLDNTDCNNGGGAYLDASPGIVVRDNLFQGNSVTGGGGGLYIAASANARLDDNRFLQNTGGEYGVGGGLYIASGAGYVLQRNRIQGNTVGYMGAGLYLAASAILSNTVIADNTLSDAYAAGAGAYINNANVTLRHATIARNRGGYGDGLYLYGSGKIITLTNVIVADQTTGINAESGNTVQVNGVLWHGNAANTGGGATFNVTNPHTGAPAFGPDGYHLTGASAAIDQGASAGVSDDVDGQPRDAQPDLGADEYISTGVELIATKSASSLVVNRGDIFTYTVAISNVSKSANATGVIVTDTLPGSQQPLAAVASAGPCGIAGTWGGTVTCVPGTIVTRTTVFITITARLLDGARLGEATTNTAIFTSNEMSGTARATIYAQDCRARLNDAATEYSTVQAAVDAAAPGDLVKIAGVCLGAFERAGLRQQVYLDKSLTLAGGYSKSNWSSPDPSVTPTTLDALGQGRVLYVTGAVSPTIEALRITGGNATGLGGQGGYDGTGGGIYVTGAAPVIRSCAIYSNVASRAGLGGGGGAYLVSSAATISDNIISDNTASTADRGQGGGLLLSNSNATVAGNTVQENVANRATGDGEGGGVYMEQAAPALHNNLILRNTASVGGLGSGGGIYATWRNTALLSNTVLVGNVSGADPTSTGSGLFVDFLSSPRLLHTSLQGNTGGYGTGVEVIFYSAAALTNTILVSQTEGIHVASDSSATLDGVLWYGNTVNTAGAGAIAVTNAHTGDPAFAADGYHLTAGSAAIDRGVAVAAGPDIDGEPRDAQPDLGADEHRSSAAPALSISRSGNDVLLAWTHDPAFSSYQVWRSTQIYFTPGAECDNPPAGQVCAVVSAPDSSYTHTGAAADVGNNYAYLLLGVDGAGQRSSPSNRVGEFGFGLTPGAP